MRDSIIGAGLTGRPSVRLPNTELEQPISYEEDGTPVYAQESAPGSSLPATCLRILHSLNPEAHGGCPSDCAGRQVDGGCLCDIVRAANEQGVEWSFEVRVTEEIDPRYGGVWTYTGPPLD